MKMSARGLVFLMREEGVVLVGYKDVTGTVTVGVGHTAAAGAPTPVVGKKITLREAMAILARDVAKFEKRVEAAVKVPLSQHQFDALVSFDFNTGRIHDATLTRLVNQRASSGAIADAFAAYNKSGGRVLEALVKRRAAESRMFNTGSYGSTVVPVWEKYPGKSKPVEGSTLLSTDPLAAAMSGAYDETTFKLQGDLIGLGYALGGHDGRYGTLTKGAIGAFRSDRGLAGDGRIDHTLLTEVRRAVAEGWRRPLDEERAEATPAEVAARVPEAAAIQTVKRTSLGATVLGVGSAATAAVGQVTGWLTPVKEFVGEVSPWAWIAVIVAGSLLAGFIAWRSQQAETANVAAFRKGERL